MKQAIIFCIGFFFYSLTIQAQLDSCEIKLASFVQNVENFNRLYPQEKVYLHFDNTGYFAGDTIWFKAYIVTATDTKPTVLSRVLYIELIAPNGQVMETKKLKIENGQCHGELTLKKDIRSGFYEVRSYTREMLNWRREIIFSRVFPVYKQPEKDGNYAQRSMEEPYRNIDFVRDKSETLDKVNVSFFPEGGNLINGLFSRIAFKATDKNGQSLHVTGAVCNEQNEEVTTFSTLHKGMGIFGFCPDKTKHHVKIRYRDKDYLYGLPEAEVKGYILTVNNMSLDYILVQLQKSEDCPNDTVGITVICRGKVSVFEMADLTNRNDFILKIPKADFSTGVHQITVFTREGNILAERMVFINHGDAIQIGLQQIKKEYKPFDKINLDFSIWDTQDNPVETTFSLAVRDAKTEIPGYYSDNIKSDLLLSSDIKGFVENADYYFKSDDLVHRQALDLLMMAQGWRRYSWVQMTGKESFEIKHGIEKGIVIDGKVSSILRKKGKDNVEVKIWMYSEDSLLQQGLCMTDKNGRFNFILEDFKGRGELTLQTKENKKIKETRISLDRFFSPKPEAYSFYETTTPETVDSSQEQENISNSEKLKSITQAQALSQVSVTKRAKAPDIVYDVEKEIDDLIDQGKFYPSNALDYLAWKNPIFQIKGKTGNSGYYTYQQNKVHIIGNIEDYDIEAYYKDKFRYFALWSIEEIQKITIFGDKNTWTKFKNISSVNEPAPVIYIEPFKNTIIRRQPGIRITHVDGYSQVKEFYNPDYSKGTLPGDIDYRRTLYWNPNVTTDAEGKASVSFYNNSSCKKMTVSAETLTSEGIPGVLEE